MEAKIKPSNIRLSQNDINNRNSEALGEEYIGVVVDRIYNGDENLLQCILDNIQIGRSETPGFEGLWYTVNNRSLWVLKQLEN